MKNTTLKIATIVIAILGLATFSFAGDKKSTKEGMPKLNDKFAVKKGTVKANKPDGEALATKESPVKANKPDGEALAVKVGGTKVAKFEYKKHYNA